MTSLLLYLKRRSHRLILGFLLFLSGVLFVPSAQAHPADMYFHALSVVFMPQEVWLTWRITPGPITAASMWQGVDANEDQVLDSVETRAYLEQEVLPYLSASLDEVALDWELVKVVWPSSPEGLRLGDEPFELKLRAEWPEIEGNEGEFELYNRFQEDNSLNWFDLRVLNSAFERSEKGVRFLPPEQQNGWFVTRLWYPFGTTSVPAEGEWLETWESGRPTLSPMEQVGTALFDEGLASRQGVLETLTDLVRNPGSSPRFYLFALTISLIVGALHALTPGHGKAIAAAYLVGTRGKIRHAIALGSVVTLTHTGSVFALGLVTLVASQYILPTTLFPILEMLSGLLIIGLGVSLLYQRWQNSFGHFNEQKGDNSNENHDSYDHHHYYPNDDYHDEQEEVIYHSHGGHRHSHIVPKAKSGVRWWSLLTLGISGGLVPCPEAIAILLIALTINRILLGLLLIVAFSLGLAGVLIAIGIVMVQSRTFFERIRIFDRIEKLAPVVSALVVLALGVALTAGAADAFGEEGEASFPSTFNLTQASIFYMAPDEIGQAHLYRLPLNTKEPQQLDKMPQGILDYALSPDGEQIAFTIRLEGGGSELWTMTKEGQNHQRLLSCIEVRCNKPSWSPDGERLLYERRDPSTTPDPLPSLWWITLATQETKPLFPDAQFPSHTANWSPDGQWLSYLSPSTSAVQLFHLADGRTHAIPNRAGHPPLWSPDSNALLTYDIQPYKERYLTHILHFDLTSEETFDLTGAEQLEDNAAAWSPDCQWIAIMRRDLGTDDFAMGNQVWLVRPDGSENKALTDEPNRHRRAPMWSPDGRFLIYQQYALKEAEAQPEIWLLNVETGEEEVLVRNGSGGRWGR